MTRSRATARAIVLSSGIVAAALALASTSAAAEPYRLEPGDVLEFSVPAIPELNQQTMVDVDGGVTLPLFGSLPVTGLTLPEVQERVRHMLSSRTFRRTSDDGREIVSVLEPDDVSITVAEYRPVYLTGDVATPGAQAYRPGMTARQAIAVAGGYDLMHFRATDPFLESADLKSDYDVLWTEFARHQAEIWRIDAELAGKTVLTRSELPEAPLPPQEFAEMINLQNALLQARVGDYRNELSFLNTGIGQADGRRSDLAEQQRIAEDGRGQGHSRSGGAERAVRQGRRRHFPHCGGSPGCQRVLAARARGGGRHCRGERRARRAVAREAWSTSTAAARSNCCRRARRPRWRSPTSAPDCRRSTRSCSMWTSSNRSFCAAPAASPPSR